MHMKALLRQRFATLRRFVPQSRHRWRTGWARVVYASQFRVWFPQSASSNITGKPGFSAAHRTLFQLCASQRLRLPRAAAGAAAPTCVTGGFPARLQNSTWRMDAKLCSPRGARHRNSTLGCLSVHFRAIEKINKIIHYI